MEQTDSERMFRLQFSVWIIRIKLACENNTEKNLVCNKSFHWMSEYTITAKISRKVSVKATVPVLMVEETCCTEMDQSLPQEL